VIGIFGGSGFYEFLDDAREEDVPTPFGGPAAPVTIGTVAGVDVAFLPRHGKHHQYPAHKVPYRSNVWAMKEVGVDRLFGPSAVGSLRMDYGPGHFVMCDQIVDRTTSRESTFYDGPKTTHVSFADPYCAELRPIAIAAGREAGATVHETGTVVVINGPRFSSRAESEFYARQGWDIINMSQHPEAALTRELEICYATVCVVTDYDVGVEGEVPPVTHAEVLARFGESIDALRDTLRRAIPRAAQTPRQCECATATGAAIG